MEVMTWKDDGDSLMILRFFFHNARTMVLPKPTLNHQLVSLL